MPSLCSRCRTSGEACDSLGAMRIFCVIAFLIASASGVFAQLLPPNDSGVSLGHIHFVVSDPDATKKAWVDVFGAVPTKAGGLDFLKLPGVRSEERRVGKESRS